MEKELQEGFLYNRGMKTVIVDAEKIMTADQPVQALAELFGLEASDIQSLHTKLQSSRELQLCEVLNWPQPQPDWETIADMLEGVQQHSNSFYLIWGTMDDLVNPDASSQAAELVNPK